MVITKTFKISLYVVDGSGNKVDIANPDTLGSVELSEFSGGLMPTGTIKLIFRSKEYIRTLNEKNTCLLHLESDSLGYSIDYPCKIVSARIDQRGRNLYEVAISICGDYFSFFNTPKTRIFKDTIGVEVIRSVLKDNGIKFNTDIESSDDMQSWVQPSCEDNVFVGSVISSLGLGELFPFYYLSFSKEAYLLSSKYISELSPISCGDSVGDIKYISVSNIINDTVRVNRAYGYGLSACEVSAGTTETEDLCELPDTNFYLTSDKEIVSDFNSYPRQLGQLIKTGNHHSGFYTSSLKGKVNSSVLTAFRLKVLVKDIPNIKIFTKIRLFVPDAENPKLPNYQLSGDYLVLEKTIKVAGQELFVDLVLGRQSINYK